MKKTALLLLVTILVFGSLALAAEEIKVPFSAVKSSCYGKIDMTEAEFLLSDIGKDCVQEDWLEANLSQDTTNGNVSVATSSQVGGIIDTDTFWTVEHSPYTVTGAVQIPDGVKLIIEPGVHIKTTNYSEMFKLKGEIYAHGTPDNRIIIEGADKFERHGIFFEAIPDGRTTPLVSLRYCTIQGGKYFWQGGSGSLFNLKHSTVKDMRRATIMYPDEDMTIEYNKFINSAGFSIQHVDNAKVYVRYNLFKDLNHVAVENKRSRSTSAATIVKYNSFIDIDNIALKLRNSYGGYYTAKMIASENYWGTQDKNKIEDMIYDENDDIEIEGKVEYDPILKEPHPDAPEA